MIKRNKRGIALVMALGLILTGCSSEKREQQQSGLDPNNPVVISLWHYYVGDNKLILESAAEEFNQTIGLEQGIIVQTVGQGNIMELEDKITSSAKGVINSDPMPDIFSSYPDKAMELDEMGAIAELNPYFSKEDQERYIPEFLNEGIFDKDRLMLVPIVKSTEILYLNQSAWEEFLKENNSSYDLDTWEGLLESSRAYYQWTDKKTPEIPWDGQAMMGFDALSNFVVLGPRQLGTQVIDGSLKGANLNHEALRHIFDIYVQGMGLGYFDAIGNYRTDDVISGDLIAYVGSTSGVSYFPTWIEKNNQRQEISFMAHTYPTFRGKELVAVQQGAGMAVSKSTPERELASALFLKWFTNYKQNVPFAMSTGYLPTELEAYESQEFKSTMESYRTGDETEQNVVKVYDIAMEQILEKETYSSSPFKGSYQIRATLTATLLEAGDLAKEAAKALKAKGKTEEEILQALEMDQRFNTWIEEVKAKLDLKEVPYKES